MQGFSGLLEFRRRDWLGAGQFCFLFLDTLDYHIFQLPYLRVEEVASSIRKNVDRVICAIFRSINCYTSFSVLPSILGKLNVKSPLATPKEPVEDDGTRKKKEPPL